MDFPKLDPETGQLAFRIAFFLFFASLLVLPLIEDEAARIVGILAITISEIFVALVIHMVRKR